MGLPVRVGPSHNAAMRILARLWLWWAWRKERRRAWKIDRRHYRPRLGPGFFAFLGQSRFWEASNDRHFPARVLKRRIRVVLALLVLGLVLWAGIISLRALGLYAT